MLVGLCLESHILEPSTVYRTRWIVLLMTALQQPAEQTQHQARQNHQHSERSDHGRQQQGSKD